MDVDSAYDLISRSIDAGSVAGGYLFCGDVAGSCAELERKVLEKLFPDERDQIAAGVHPDVARLAPEGRKGSIHVKTVRESLLAPMSVSSFSGGWKVGVIAGADRMEEAAANAFLKTLEEPPPHTLFILETDSPDSILPTIRSRCQRVDLPGADGVLEGEAFEAVAAVMRERGLEGTFAKSRAARRLAEVLTSLREGAADEEGDASAARRAFFRTVMRFVRDWMVRGELPLRQAAANVEAVEDAYRKSSRSIGDVPVLCHMMERMVFP